MKKIVQVYFCRLLEKLHYTSQSNQEIINPLSLHTYHIIFIFIFFLFKITLFLLLKSDVTRRCYRDK